MGLLSTLAKGAGSLLGGDTLKDVGGIIDNLHTSGEEKAAAKERITQITYIVPHIAYAIVPSSAFFKIIDQLKNSPHPILEWAAKTKSMSSSGR